MSAIQLQPVGARSPVEPSRRQPPSAEVTRRETWGVAGVGAMLYDASRAGNLAVPWFEPRYWIAQGAVLGKARGRGDTLIVQAGERRLVLRHYRRGGFIARFTPDRYWWRNEPATRPFAEWRLTRRLFEAGLPVPAPIGARYVREGRTYRGDLLTEFLADTHSLAARLAAGRVPQVTWLEIGRTLRRFHDFGLCHADLNAHNLLLRGDQTVHLIDFDRGALRRPGLWRDGNLVRLRRSLEKLGDASAASLFAEEDWHCLLAGYRG